MITKENIELYKTIRDELKKFADKVFHYIEVNGYSQMLFHVEKAYNIRQYINGENFCIPWEESTCHDCPDYGIIEIPLNEIYKDTWKEWIDNKCEDIRELWLERERKDQEAQEKREKELLKQLKNKYGEV